MYVFICIIYGNTYYSLGHNKALAALIIVENYTDYVECSL